MFLISLKTLKGKFFLLTAAVVAAVVVFTVLSSSENKEISPADGVLNFSAATDEERLSFINQLGFSVNSEPVSVTEVIIPEQFDEVYEQYNTLQQEAGLDLAPYKGCTAKKWTYTVTNYPQYENSDVIRLNLLIYKGRIIGGDVCSVELDGFMTSLTNQESLWQRNDLTN